MDSTMEDTVTLGCMPSLEIELALATGDSDKVFQLERSGIPPKVFADAVRTHMFNASNQARKGRTVIGQHNSSLFMWPVIFRNAETAQNALQSDKTLLTDTSNALLHWMSFKADVGMLPIPFSYSFIAGQGAIELRKLLDVLTWRQNMTVTGMNYEDATLPSDAPQLAFYLGSMTRMNNWPALPDPTAFATLEISKRLHSNLRFFAQSAADSDPTDILVGVPEIAEVAIVTGLRLWLTALHEKYEFGKWDAAFCGGDRVDLGIELTNNNSIARIPLRSYQIGIEGIEKILNFASTLGTTNIDPSSWSN